MGRSLTTGVADLRYLLGSVALWSSFTWFIVELTSRDISWLIADKSEVIEDLAFWASALNWDSSSLADDELSAILSDSISGVDERVSVAQSLSFVGVADEATVSLYNLFPASGTATIVSPLASSGGFNEVETFVARVESEFVSDTFVVISAVAGVFVLEDSVFFITDTTALWGLESSDAVDVEFVVTGFNF